MCIRDSVGCVWGGVAVSCTSSEPAQPQYTDEELGLDEIVDKKMVSGVLMFAQHRTLEERDRDRPDPLGGSGHERERNFFEHNMRMAATPTQPSNAKHQKPDGHVSLSMKRLSGVKHPPRRRGSRRLPWSEPSRISWCMPPTSSMELWTMCSS